MVLQVLSRRKNRNCRNTITQSFDWFPRKLPWLQGHGRRECEAQVQCVSSLLRVQYEPCLCAAVIRPLLCIHHHALCNTAVSKAFFNLSETTRKTCKSQGTEALHTHINGRSVDRHVAFVPAVCAFLFKKKAGLGALEFPCLLR